MLFDNNLGTFLGSFTELLIRILLTVTRHDPVAEQVWTSYCRYEAGKLESRDPEKDFVAGVTLLALGEFKKSIAALWNAIDGYKRVDLEQMEKVGSGEELKPIAIESLIRYSEYLVKSYLMFLRYRQYNAKEIKLADVERILSLLQNYVIEERGDRLSPKTDIKVKELVAMAHEAASRCACSQRDEKKTRQYFRIANENYEKVVKFYKDSQTRPEPKIPKKFLEWKEYLVNSHFCSED